MSAIKIYDIETFANCFTFVAKSPGEKTYDTFVIHDGIINQGKELVEYLQQNLIFVGYNCVKFDAQVLEIILQNGGNISGANIYDVAQRIIEGEIKPISHVKLSTRQIDLYSMWSFDTTQRRCSLKWLEFTMRMKKLKDLPFHHSKQVTKNQQNDVLKYNKYDVDITEHLYSLSSDKIHLRKTLYEQYGVFEFFSKGDTSLGSDTFLIDLAEEMGTNVKKLQYERTHYDSLKLKDVILHDRVKPMRHPSFVSVLENFNKIKLTKDEDGLLNLKGALAHEVHFDGIDFKYGTGGLHASVSNKLIRADENHLIIDVDVASFYPNLAITNGLFPKHLSKHFLKKYKDLYEERKLIPKTNLLNLAKKLSLNAIFGKSNSKYSYLFDQAFFLGITINGQLFLSMLAEQLARCSKIIQVNTDGVTVMVHKDQKHLVEKVVKWWEKQTDLVLETAEYSQMAISDVNNYHAITTDGKVKRKGKYCIYEDYVKMQDFHKNPSHIAISVAIDAYLTEMKPVNDTIYTLDDIHDFCAGFKKKSNFDFLIATPDKKGFVDMKVNSDRVIRYFVSEGGSSIYKVTDKNGLTTLAKGLTVSLSQNITKNSLDHFNNLNKEWYIEKAQEIIDSLELVDNTEFVKDKFIKNESNNN